MLYIAAKHSGDQWYPTDPSGMAKVMQWLALSNNEIHYGLQWARGVVKGYRAGNLEDFRAYGRQALDVSEDGLKNNAWLALRRPTIADIACYPYVAVAPEGVLSLDAYVAVSAWVERVEVLPGWILRL